MSNSINKASFRFSKFTILESYFQMTDSSDFEINIKVNPTGRLSKNNKTFLLEQQVEVSDENNKFKINIRTSAQFDFDEVLDDEKSFSFFIINAPAIVFPYIRAYISNMTALSGLSTITLPTLNLSEMSKVLKDNIEIVE